MMCLGVDEVWEIGGQRMAEYSCTCTGITQQGV